MPARTGSIGSVVGVRRGVLREPRSGVIRMLACLLVAGIGLSASPALAAVSPTNTYRLDAGASKREAASRVTVKAVGAESTGTARSVLRPASVNNSLLAVQVGDDGKFNFGAYPDPYGNAGANSWNISYAWDLSPWTSYSTVRIDDTDYIFGSDSNGYFNEYPTDLSANTNETQWSVAGIRTTQRLSLQTNPLTGRQDMCAITYTLTNTDYYSHDVGLRILIDTMIDSEDGCLFGVPGSPPITTESQWWGNDTPDTLHVLKTADDSEQLAGAQFRIGGAVPDRVVIGYWPTMHNTPWDYWVDWSRELYPDSAYAAYWDPITLAPGQSVTWTNGYGLEKVTSLNQPTSSTGTSVAEKPVVVLVGGLESNYGYAGAKVGGGSDLKNPWHDTYEYLRTAGYQVYVPPMRPNTLVSDDVMDSTGGFLSDSYSRLDTWLSKQGIARGRSVVLVGHSMGGLISRGYAEKWYQRPKSGLVPIGIYQMDTPNLGSPLSAMARYSYFKESVAVEQLDQDGTTIPWFNSSIAPNAERIPIRRLASDFFPDRATDTESWNPFIGAQQSSAVLGFIASFGVPNDGAVSVSSAYWAPNSDEYDEDSFSGVHSDSWPMNLWSAAEVLPPSRKTSDEYDILRNVLSFVDRVAGNDAPPTQPVTAQASGQAPPAIISALAVSPSELAGAPGWTNCADTRLVLSAGADSLVPFTVEGTSAVICVAPSAGSPSISVTGSGGAVVPTSVTVADGKSIAAMPCLPGSYTAHIGLSGVATASASVTVLDSGQSELRVVAATQAPAGSSSAVEAAIYAGGLRRTGGTLTAAVGAGTPVAMRDNGVAPDTASGDGVFTANLTMPSSGSADVTVRASGLDAAGRAFARVGHASVAVGVARARLTGAYIWRTSKGASGKVNELLIDARVAASQACTLQVNAVVSSGGKVAAQPTEVVHFSAGQESTVTLSVPADQMHGFATSGVFTVSTVTLSDESDGPITLLQSASPGIGGTIAPAGVEYAACSLAVVGPVPTNSNVVRLSGEAVCTTDTISAVQLTFDEGATWRAVPALAQGVGSKDTSWTADYMMPEGFYGVSSRVLGSNGNPIPGAQGHCSFVVDRTAPVTTDDHVGIYASSASIHIIPHDSLSQVSWTDWMLDGEWGYGPLVSTSQLGYHTLTYYSSDNAGNTESATTVGFLVVPPKTSRVTASGARSVKVRRSYKLSGTVTPSTASGPVKIVLQRRVGKRWKAAGSLNAKRSGSKYTCSFKPRYRGSWKATAFYAGALTADGKFSAASATKSFKVK